MSTKHTPGPWTVSDNLYVRADVPKEKARELFGPNTDHISHAEIVAQISRSKKLAVDCDWQGDAKEVSAANARLIAAAPEMLMELKLANKIIMNALNVMTSDQKLAWDELNTRDDLKDGWALTRNGAREAVIAKAEVANE